MFEKHPNISFCSIHQVSRCLQRLHAWRDVVALMSCDLLPIASCLVTGDFDAILTTVLLFEQAESDIAGSLRLTGFLPLFDLPICAMLGTDLPARLSGGSISLTKLVSRHWILRPSTPPQRATLP